MVTIGDIRDYIRVLLYSYYTTITGWGVLLMNHYHHKENLFMKGRVGYLKERVLGGNGHFSVEVHL